MWRDERIMAVEMLLPRVGPEGGKDKRITHCENAINEHAIRDLCRTFVMGEDEFRLACQRAGRTPNPWEGIITPGREGDVDGPTSGKQVGSLQQEWEGPGAPF